jgi:SAM-dependent methyltransferase
MIPATALTVEHLTQCPICGASAADTVLTHPDGYLPNLHLQRCCQCQMIYLNPRLTLESIIAVEDESEVYSFDRETAERWINDSLTQWISFFEGYVRTPGRRLLDIGCNRGLLMEAARRRGWQPIGVEISSESANRARSDYGLTVYDALERVAATPQFDLITAWHVLEHTLNPVDFLLGAVARLVPGGVLALQVPSFDFLEQFRQRDQMSGLVCSVHNFYFTEANLPPLLARTGLQVQHFENNPDGLALTAICTKPPAARPWWRRWLGRERG